MSWYKMMGREDGQSRGNNLTRALGFWKNGSINSLVIDLLVRAQPDVNEPCRGLLRPQLVYYLGD